MLHTVSHVLFPYGRQPFIYTFLCSVFASVRLDRLPYQIWVSRLRGLPVPSALFPEQLVSVALLQHEYRSSSLPSLSPQASMQPSGRNLPGFIVSSSTNTTVIADRASMDFPLASLPATVRIQHHFLKTSYSKRERRLRISICEDCCGCKSTSAPCC